MTVEGLYNFRDTGGLPLAAGGTTRSGVLFRSAALDGLTPAGLAALAATDIGVVVDFRTDTERQSAPDRLPTSRPFQVDELALLQGAMSDMTKQLAPGSSSAVTAVPSPEQMAKALESLPTLGDLYTVMLAQGAAAFVQVAKHIAASSDAAPTAVLVHCTAGKDRTGVATALMLDAAGVERDAIVADYASSQQHLAGPWAEGMLAKVTALGVPLTPALKTLITGTPPEAIERALAWVDDTHGGSANYLVAAGLPAADLAQLQRRIAA